MRGFVTRRTGAEDLVLGGLLLIVALALWRALAVASIRNADTGIRRTRR